MLQELVDWVVREGADDVRDSAEASSEGETVPEVKDYAQKEAARRGAANTVKIPIGVFIGSLSPYCDKSTGAPTGMKTASKRPARSQMDLSAQSEKFTEEMFQIAKQPYQRPFVKDALDDDV